MTRINVCQKTTTFIAMLLLFVACHETEKPDLLGNNGSLTFRSDCDDCDAQDECCCYVELDEDTQASLHLCGTSDGAGACSGQTCDTGTPNGGGQSVALTSSLNRRQAFCMFEMMPLTITNTSGSDPADIIISCQNGSMVPQTLQLSIPASGTKKVETNSACEVDECS